MAINPTHVVMGRNIAASGSLAGEMKVAAISGSTGLTLNEMLIRLDDNSTAQLAELRGSASSAYDDFKKVEDIIVSLQSDVDANELASDNAESALDARLDIIEAGDSQAGSVAKAQADAEAFATAAINDLVAAAPAALDTLNELAAAMGDDANFGTTVTNAIAAVQSDVNANEAVSDAVIGVSGGSHMGTFTGAIISDNGTIKAALQELETRLTNAQLDVDQNESDADAAIAANEVHIDNAATLSGVAKDAVNLGTFTGTTIQDNRTVKQALQELETKADGQTADLDLASGFHVENSGGVYKLGWGAGKPRVSFSISGSDVTMSVDVE